MAVRNESVEQHAERLKKAVDNPPPHAREAAAAYRQGIAARAQAQARLTELRRQTAEAERREMFCLGAEQALHDLFCVLLDKQPEDPETGSRVEPLR